MSSFEKREDGFYREGPSKTSPFMKFLIVAVLAAVGFGVGFALCIYLTGSPRSYSNRSSRTYRERVPPTAEVLYRNATYTGIGGAILAGGFGLYCIFSVSRGDRRRAEDRLREGRLPSGVPPSPPPNRFDQFGPKE